ncbi:MAG: hypothetical protein A3F72_18625 [Bacteroidetes bacterium RIFCSPLOWO2_12_FULL_35_15]|nr:MAG: hypothetical protein A3F72_18625 [Bacteroidetes bacterium RIFCSPLOWO2_12_FULL_35_15]
MKNIQITLLLIIGALTLFGFKLKQQSDLIQIPCEEIKIKCTQSRHGNFIINDYKEYKDLLTIRSPHPDCENYELPPIDFNNYTLLGVVSSTAGCSNPIISHFVTKNTNNEFILNVNSEQRGLCERNWRIKIWCLIPKVTDKSKIKFNIVKK